MQHTALHVRLRAERVHRKWSQKHVADLLGVSQQRITQIENGEKPSPDLLKRFSDLYAIELSELMALIVTRGPEVSKQEEELLSAIRSRDIRRTMKLVETLIYAQ